MSSSIKQSSSANAPSSSHFDSIPHIHKHAANMDVVVIGGGIVGSSIAWHLAPEANVTIIAEKLGGVATPLSFAWINAATTDPEYYDFRLASMNHWKEIHEQLPELDIKFNKALYFTPPPDELQEYLDTQVARGYDIVKVDSTEIQDLEPTLNDIAIPDWAVLANEEGQMEAELVARGLIENAQKTHGAKVIEDTAFGLLKDEAGRVTGVKTSHGAIKADHVVLAAGIGCNEFLASENITIPLEPREGLLVNSKPTETHFLNSLYQGDELHMRQTSYGVIRSGRDFAGGDPGDNPDGHAEDLFGKVKAALKGGDELELAGYTIGRRPQPEDGFPLLGHTGVHGLTLAVMHSGVTNGAIVGKLISKQVLTNVTDPLMAPFTLERLSK